MDELPFFENGILYNPHIPITEQLILLNINKKSLHYKDILPIKIGVFEIHLSKINRLKKISDKYRSVLYVIRGNKRKQIRWYTVLGENVPIKFKELENRIHLQYELVELDYSNDLPQIFDTLYKLRNSNVDDLIKRSKILKYVS